MLGYLSKGAITYGDSNDMTPHERKLAMDILKEILGEQQVNTKGAIQEAKKKIPDVPKSGLSH